MTELRVVREIWGKGPFRKPTSQYSPVMVFMTQTTAGYSKKQRGRSNIDASYEEEEEEYDK